MFLPKVLLTTFLFTSTPQDFANVDYSALPVEDQPSSCELQEQYEDLQEERPLTDEEGESLDFFARACGVQRGAEALTGIVDDFGNAINELQQPTVELNEYLTMMQRMHDPNAYNCC